MVGALHTLMQICQEICSPLYVLKWSKYPRESLAILAWLKINTRFSSFPYLKPFVVVLQNISKQSQENMGSIQIQKSHSQCCFPYLPPSSVQLSLWDWKRICFPRANFWVWTGFHPRVLWWVMLLGCPFLWVSGLGDCWGISIPLWFSCYLLVASVVKYPMRITMMFSFFHAGSLDSASLTNAANLRLRSFLHPGSVFAFASL